MIYGELANPTEYSADFNDITLGGALCVAGFDNLLEGVAADHTAPAADSSSLICPPRLNC